MARKLEHYTGELYRIFGSASSKHEAHYRSQAVLRDMASDSSVLGSIFTKYLARPEVLNTRHYPVIGIDVELNAHYGLVANCWIPLPDHSTNVTTKAIHHHGEMLLTSITAFGTGYEHWTFSRPVLADPEEELFTTTLLAREHHPLGHVAFVDAYVGHVPLYAGSLSITFALWSHRSRTSWKDHLKRLPFLRGREDFLRELAARLGVARALELKIVDYFDFCPTERGFRGVRERREFPRGPNPDFLASLFHVLQRTGQLDLAPLLENHLRSIGRVDDPDTVERLLRDLRQGRDIEPRLSDGHYGQAHANFTTEQIERSLMAPTRG